MKTTKIRSYKSLNSHKRVDSVGMICCCMLLKFVQTKNRKKERSRRMGSSQKCYKLPADVNKSKIYSCCCLTASRSEERQRAAGRRAAEHKEHECKNVTKKCHLNESCSPTTVRGGGRGRYSFRNKPSTKVKKENNRKRNIRIE